MKMFFCNIDIDKIAILYYNTPKDNKGIKMTTTIGVRDISRNINMLQDYDYVDIKDKKTQEYKGLLVSNKYADEIKAFLNKKLKQEKQKELDEIMQFAGMFDGESQNMTAKEIQESKIKRYTFDD